MLSKRAEGRKCVFCKGVGLSREHFWPEWAYQHLDQEHVVNNVRTRVLTSRGSIKISGLEKGRISQGSLAKVKMKTVCKKCNNEWMSSCENSLKDLLLLLLKAQPAILDKERQRALARWIAMKIIAKAAEYDDENIYADEDCAAIRDKGQAPDRWIIRIAQHESRDWRVAFGRTSVPIVVSEVGGEEFYSETVKRNTQLVTFGFGRLAISVFSTRVLGFLPPFAANAPVGWYQISPYNGDIVWPTGRNLTTAEIASYANALAGAAGTHSISWVTNNPALSPVKKTGLG